MSACKTPSAPKKGEVGSIEIHLPTELHRLVTGKFWIPSMQAVEVTGVELVFVAVRWRDMNHRCLLNHETIGKTLAEVRVTVRKLNLRRQYDCV